MPNITLNITGTTELLKRFNKIDNKAKTEVKNEINASVIKIQADAKKLAPVNLGNLRNSIYMIEESRDNNKFLFGVGSSARYAPYVEFGTGGKVSIPVGFESYASQFKGKTNGTFKDMVLALTDWVQKKGITGKGGNARSAAYAIALSILRKGMRPHPFLIPAFEQEKSKLLERIQKILKNA